jgi:predicted nucleotidyltransferase
MLREARHSESQTITREQAREAAEACTRLLKEHFGAARVILFGSAAGQNAWHDRSDIDLAVEGLAPEQFFTAYAACHEMLPRGLGLDLVPLEKVYPEMRARILGEAPMPDHPILAIQALVEDEMTALERVTHEMADLLAERADPPTRTELRAIAGILHEFYNGVERILQHIAVGLGEGVPQGAYWHADLLAQMAAARESARSAVIDEPLRARLKEYLEFRHFFRHAYGYTLAWDQLRWKAESLPDTLARLGEQLHGFFESLIGPRSTESPN